MKTSNQLRSQIQYLKELRLEVLKNGEKDYAEVLLDEIHSLECERVDVLNDELASD